MNKTLALIAALGLVVAAPAFANEEAKTDAAAKTEQKADKKLAGAEKAEKAAKATPAAGEKEEKKEEGAK